MKKMLLFSMMALAGLFASAQQFNSKPSAVPQTKSKVQNMPQSQRSFQAVTPRQNLGIRFDGPSGKQLTLDLAKVKPVTRAQRALFAMQNETNVLGKGKMQNRKMVNLQPTMTLNSKTSTRAKAARKASALAETYTGVGYDYYKSEDLQWTMTPSTATLTTDEGDEEVNVLVDVIPTPEYLAELYPDGIPVVYTVEDDSIITIEPQAVAHYEDEENGTTNYITLFAANSDDEDGIINMVIRENGKLAITNGNWISFGEFADVEFDEELQDGEAFLGLDELVVNVGYYYRYETTIDKEYNGHGADYFESVPVDWVMQRGTVAVDDDEVHFFVDMVPLIDVFSGIYPNGIDVEYEQAGNIITVKPQVIAHIPADEENEEEYIMLSSYDSEDGSIVLTEGENGSLKTVDGESIVIGAWSTSKFDPTWESYLGAYVLIKNVKYHQPGDPAEAPTDVLCEPNDLVLFAGVGYSSYMYSDNLAVMAAYAPTTFRNHTMDIATNFEWSVKETDGDDVETTITGNDRDFTLNTKGDATYEEFVLTAYNEDAASEPFTWGIGHCPNSDETGPNYEAIRVYAGASASSFMFTDGSYATMTRQNPDGDLRFYGNWATPDIYENSSISTIYSYQGKPVTPLYITGVTLPLVSFEAKEDFNLHIKLCKCTRSATGRLTVGDIIVEGDATNENVNADYDKGIKAVEFTELYKEDEFGMSETIDYLFIEDEFVIIIEGWDNGTFSGVLGSQDIDVSILPSAWFTLTGEEEGSLHYYTTWFPQLFIGLLDATYGYLHTEDETNLMFNRDGGTSSIHIEPLLYGVEDPEAEEPVYTYSLGIESVIEDGEEVEEIPEWINIEIANEDYTTATAVSETTGEEYEYFVNGIDYDMVITTEALPEGVANRTCQILFYQPGAKLTVTITQDVDADGVSSIVATPVKNSRAFNLAGQPVHQHYKGIVVKDGKKVLVK